MPRTTPRVEMLEAKEAIVVVVGARPIEYQRQIVRNKRTGELAEIDMHELPPLDPGDEATPYAFRAGERVRSDHPAVAACPGGLRPVDD